MLAGLLAAHLWVRRVLPTDVRSVAARFAPSAWWLLALPMCWNSVMRLMNSRADPAMLGWLSNAEAAAYFSVANRLASLLLFGMLAVNAVAAPLIAELHSQGKRRELQDMLTLTAKGLTLYALPLALVLIVGGRWILAVFGPEYVAAYPVLVLLVIGRTLTCLFGTVGFLLAMTGHQNYVAKVVTVCAALKVGLNLALIPSFGASGAAAATTVMLSLMGFALYRYVRRELDLEPSILALFASRSETPRIESEVPR
ncbi:MAG: polysaccharide biosynthesis C-terminal domain-containing protein [Planctomycetes bacterium]|nr:polysaccharide biosynthesis C-terminal domain-containing protein [Planctomycetota bacterium]